MQYNLYKNFLIKLMQNNENKKNKNKKKKLRQ